MEVLDENRRKELHDKFQRYREWKNIVLFDDTGKVLVSKMFKEGVVKQEEITALLSVFDSEDKTFGSGITFLGTNYEVHNYDEKLSLVYGRTFVTSSHSGVGIALCRVKVDREGSDRFLFTLITFPLPTLTSRGASQLYSFCNQALK